MVKRIPDVGRLLAGCPTDIRSNGWAVAVHNDYRQDGRRWTFWLFTRVVDDGTLRAVKGEGHTDAEALDQIRVKLGLEPYFMGGWKVHVGG